MKILLDAMGGDNAPDAVIKGAVKAASEIKSEIILIGNEEIINGKVKEFYNKETISEVDSKISIKHCSEQIEMVDIPTAKEVLVRIEDIITAPTFVLLNVKLINMGLLSDGGFSLTNMRKYYSIENESKYGVVGIRIKVVDFSDME